MAVKCLNPSLVARFEDLVGFTSCVLKEHDLLEEKVKSLLQKLEEKRLEWLQERNVAIETKKRLEVIKLENEVLSTTLQETRLVLKKLLLEKKTFLEERQDFRLKLLKGTDISAIDSCLNQLRTNYNISDSSESVICGDDNEGLQLASSTKVVSEVQVNPPLEGPQDEDLSLSPIAVRPADTNPVIAQIFTNTEAIYEIKIRTPQVEEMAASTKERHQEAVAKTFARDLFRTQFSPQITSLPQEAVTKTLARDLFRTLFSPQITSLPHDFVSKKIFRPGVKCGPCGRNFAFCSTCVKCKQCHVTAHPNCKENVAMPCIPRVHEQSSKKSEAKRLVLQDLIGENDVPPIPGLISLCVEEIEKRGLNEEGLYIVSGDFVHIKKLKQEMLKNKGGSTELSDYDIHVLTCVIKDVLRSLKEPLVTRALWRDFVRVAQIADAGHRQDVIEQAVRELPPANRATLAFLMVHFLRITRCPFSRVTTKSLAIVLAPTIIGNSAADLPILELEVENKVQILVMEALFEVSFGYWLSSVGSVAPLLSKDVFKGRRSSLILIGGTIEAEGSMTPMPKAGFVRKVLSLKPLF